MAARAEVAAETRERLLRVAERVVGRDGGGGLTLDAVACEAGITKGGVLYHFGSKDALIAAMIDRLGGAFERDVAAAAAGEAEAGGGVGVDGAWTRAYASASFQPGDEHADQVGVSAALFAAVAADPALLDPLRARYAAWQRRLEADGVDPAAATVVRLAADGLVLAELLGLAPPGPELRARVFETLASMTRGDKP